MGEKTRDIKKERENEKKTILRIKGLKRFNIINLSIRAYIALNTTLG